MQVAGISVHLLTLSGACLGTEVKLASDNIPFGSVVLGSQVALAFSTSGNPLAGLRVVAWVCLSVATCFCCNHSLLATWVYHNGFSFPAVSMFMPCQILPSFAIDLCCV